MVFLPTRYGTNLGAINLQYVITDEQVADVLTKPLSRVKFEYFRDKLGAIRKNFPRKDEQ